MCVVRNANFQA